MIIKKLKHLEAELNSIYDKQSKGAHNRFTTNWGEKGETTIIFFLNLKRHHQSFIVITELIKKIIITQR